MARVATAALAVLGAATLAACGSAPDSMPKVAAAPGSLQTEVQHPHLFKHFTKQPR